MMAGSLRMFAPLGMFAALVLLGGCSSDDMADGSGAGGAGAGGAGGGGISSSALAGQPVPGTQEDLEVTVGDRVFFEFDSAVLSPIATQTLDRQGAWLQQYPEIVLTVEGHTDERGTRESIWRWPTAVRTRSGTTWSPWVFNPAGSSPSLMARSGRPSLVTTRPPGPRTGAR